MKKVFIIWFLCLMVNMYAILNVIVDDNRFFDDTFNTILEINYQVPYNGLKFERSEYGYTALLQVNVTLIKDDTEVYNQEFTNKIILTNEEKTLSNEKFLDKIILTLSQSGFFVKINFKDLLAEKDKEWKYHFETLKPEALISDLELSTDVKKDTTFYLEKFHRNNYLFSVNTDHIYSLPEEIIICLYYEIQNFFADSQNKSNLIETITIQKKGEILEQFQSGIIEQEDKINRIKKINIQNFESGYYEILLEIEDTFSGYKEIKKDYFSIRINKDVSIRLFPDIENEIKLIKYFLPSSQTNIWKTLADKGKENFINRFWTANDPDPSTSENEFLQEIRNRITYTNSKFSHFDDGWSTDRGRIHIKYGPPDEILKLRTGLYTKYITKDYEIWKYRSKYYLTYIFIDLLTTGSYRLIYSEDDDTEVTLPDWDLYLDRDFDETLLE